MRRYSYTPQFQFGTSLGTSETVYSIRLAIKNGSLSYTVITLVGSTRLDHLAGFYYQDPTLWWAIAAASNIGWGMQLPAGTHIRIPDQGSLASLLG